MAVKLVYTKSSTPYIDAYNQEAAKMATARDAYRQGRLDELNTSTNRLNESRTTDLNNSNAQYDATAKQNYINYMQSQKNLPSQLNALGIRGGASESSLIRLGNTYGTNVASNETARATALDSIRKAYADQLASLEDAYNSDLRNYDSTYNQNLASAYATAQAKQITWEKEQQQKDLEYFSGVIEGLYGSTEAYDKLIAKLKKSKDPNKGYKIKLAQKAKQTLIDKIGESSGGGGGYGGGYSYGGGGGYSYDSSNASNAGKSAASAVTNAVKKYNNSRSKSNSSKSNSGSNKKYTNNLVMSYRAYK